MRDEWTPNLPKNRTVKCVTCGKDVTGTPFIATKRAGRTLYAHTDCFKKEHAHERRRSGD